MIILVYCLAFFGGVVLLSAFAIFIMAFWFEIRFSIGKDNQDNGKA